MCFSTEVSAGVAVVLLPVGGYCLAAAAVKDRAYLPLAALPLLFGVQQVFEGAVWFAVGRHDPVLARAASGAFLFFALAVWPVGVPLAAAALERPGRRRRAFVGLAAAGLAVAAAYFVPVAAGGWEGPRVVGHSLRYDLPDPGPVWPAAYLAAVCVPLAASRVPAVRPLGWLALAAAGVSYVAFREAFASVWCFLAAALSGYLAYVLCRVPDPRAWNLGTESRPPALQPT
ncbi:DUF6629 family protein [Urbifossiella limnaea]|uniref:Uncharacterized protein n=1 Tax=Urbifossiella limnaea TaxID=2528023 RepID=A0A517Y1G8_9BACT|nr:DUF6629 family protein [Urbifossiella limnaea]QDU23621.1 hypothetical protein ETAA1_56250 [Urbifossiella limnaea]